MRRKASGPRVKALLHLLDEAFDHQAWHGTNLRGAVRGLTAAAAAWRPHATRHNVWEIVVHAAYWKYAVRRRLTREKRGSFALQGSNWFARPSQDRTDAAWSADVRLLAKEHEQLRRIVEGLRDADLDRRSGGSRWTKSALIRGVACHDLYHAGQIQLLKRMRPTRTRSR